VHPDKPVIHVSGDYAIGLSGVELETLCCHNMPVKIVVFNNGGIGPGHPEIPENPMFNMKPNAPIYGARHDKMMEAFGGTGFMVENPKDLRGALDEAMNHKGPTLVKRPHGPKTPPESCKSSAGTADPPLTPSGPDDNAVAREWGRLPRPFCRTTALPPRWWRSVRARRARPLRWRATRPPRGSGPPRAPCSPCGGSNSGLILPVSKRRLA
jgi:hypothetical protein